MRAKTFDPAPLPRPPRGLPQAPHRGFGAELKLVRGWNLTLWSGVGAPPRALCELHSGPHVKKIVLRLRSKKAEISKRLWPRNRKNGKRIYSYYGLQTRYAVWRSRSHYCVVSLNHPCMRDQITHCRALAAAPDLPTGQTTPRTSRGRPCRHGLALKPYFSGRRRGCAPAAPIQNTVGGGGQVGSVNCNGSHQQDLKPRWVSRELFFLSCVRTQVCTYEERTCSRCMRVGLGA